MLKYPWGIFTGHQGTETQCATPTGAWINVSALGDSASGIILHYAHILVSYLMMKCCGFYVGITERFIIY